jgi:inosose dehydratase
MVDLTHTTGERVRLAYQSNTWGGVVGHPVGVTSVKDLYYLANGSTVDALRDIANAGYEGVELFDGNVVEYAERAEEFAAMLNEHALELVAVYSGANFIFADILDQELWRIDRAASLGAHWGARYLVVGGGAQTLAPPGDAEYQRLGAALNRVVDIADRHGLDACFHPHLTTIVETADQLERLSAHTSIQFCPDTGHVLLAGDDPASVIRRHGDRISYVHLKDVDPDKRNFVPLGTGALDLDDIMSALDEIGYDGWVTIELDAWSDPYDGARTGRHAMAPWLQHGRQPAD